MTDPVGQPAWGLLHLRCLNWVYIWDVADCVVMAEMAKSIDGEAVMGSISNRRCRDNARRMKQNSKRREEFRGLGFMVTRKYG